MAGRAHQRGGNVRPENVLPELVASKLYGVGWGRRMLVRHFKTSFYGRLSHFEQTQGPRQTGEGTPAGDCGRSMPEALGWEARMRRFGWLRWVGTVYGPDGIARFGVLAREGAGGLGLAVATVL